MNAIETEFKALAGHYGISIIAMGSGMALIGRKGFEMIIRFPRRAEQVRHAFDNIISALHGRPERGRFGLERREHPIALIKNVKILALPSSLMTWEQYLAKCHPEDFKSS